MLHSRCQLFLISFLIFLITLLLGSVTLFYPFGIDHGEYATIAKEISSGKAVYRDVFNIKPPLTHVVHGLALGIFGCSMQSIRIFDLIWQAITASLLFFLIEHLFRNRLLSVLSALFYVLWYYSLSFWNTAQTDGFITLPVLISLFTYHLYLSRGETRLAVISGIAISIAVLFKYPIGVLLLFLLIITIVKHRADCRKGVLFLLIGFTAPIACFFAFLAIQGTLNEFLYIQRNYIPQYNTINFYAFNPVNFFLSNKVMLLLFPSIIGIAVLKRYEKSSCVLLVSLWWSAALIHLVSQNKFFVYHGLPLIASSAVLTAYLIVVVCNKICSSQKHKYIYLCIVILVTASPYMKRCYNTGGHVTLAKIAVGKMQLNEVYAEFNNGIYYSAKPTMAVAAYINSHTNKHATLFIWGFDPTIYFLADRNAGSRFIYNFPLCGNFVWLREFRKQLISELKKNKPQYIIVVENDAAFWITSSTDDSMTSFKKFYELSNLVAKHYTFEKKIQNFYLYCRKPGWSRQTTPSKKTENS